jgi:hypothetical protein
MAVKVKINNIQPAFNNAHRLLWEKYNPEGRILNHREVEPLCVEWWLKEHNVQLHGYVGLTTGWEYAEFQTAEEITHFVLKYN